jgi:Na+-driven multidrug efflux pump
MLLAKLINTDFSGIGRITWPAFVELVLPALFGMVDLIMLGQTPDSATACSIGD